MPFFWMEILSQGFEETMQLKDQIGSGPRQKYYSLSGNYKTHKLCPLFA